MSKRKPQDLWKQLVDEASEEEIDRAASVSVEQAEAELAAAGFDVAAERAKAAAFLDALEHGAEEPREPEVAGAEATAPGPPAVAAVAQVAPPAGRRRPRRAVVLLAAAATVTVGAGVLYAAMHRAPEPALPPPLPPSTPLPAPSPGPDLVAAARLRHQAAAACDAKQWTECLDALDRARAIDAAGDDTAPVRSLRNRANAGLEQK
jgi:hypothetical protein